MTYTTRIAEAKSEAFEDGFSAGEEHGFSLGRNEGISLGITQAKLETAKNMRFRNIPIDVISECTGLSIEVIQDLADKQIIKNARNYKTGRYYINEGKTDGSLAKRL